MKASVKCSGKRILAFALAVITLTGVCTAPAFASETIGNGVGPTCDEAYYGITDYYGNLTEGSVVKSYIVNGAETLTDYGDYDEIVNLTDATAPETEDGSTVFRFSKDKAPTHFYFEGKTVQPFSQLPWTISLHYTLNGVPADAAELAGKTGVVEIFFDAVPNPAATEYARYNYTLEAMAIFNQDDILSLEAPGAQVQLVGNLRTVLFVILPGEEQHFSIRVGAEDFSFGGMTFLMVPATLSQLEEVAKLSQKKDELEENYNKLSGSVDGLLDALNSLTGSLNESAAGLDALNQARDTFSSGKENIYTGLDAIQGDLSGLAEQLTPVAERVKQLQTLTTDGQKVLTNMSDTCTELQKSLSSLEHALGNLEDIAEDELYDTISHVISMKSDLTALKKSLETLTAKKIAGAAGQVMGNSENMKQVKAVHSAYEEKDRDAFLNKMLAISGSTATTDSLKQAAEMAEKWAAAAGSTDPAELLKFALSQGVTMEQAKTVLTGYGTYQELLKLFSQKEAMTFTQFCETVLKLKGDPDAADTAKKMNSAWLEYKGLTSYGSGSSATVGTSAAQDAVEAIKNALAEKGIEVDAATEAALNTLLREMNNAGVHTAAVLDDLSRLCTDLDKLRDAGMMDEITGASSDIRGASKHVRAVLDDMKHLNTLLEDYQPTLQAALENTAAVSSTAASLSVDAASLLETTQDLMRRSGSQLDAGTQQTLSALAATLRRAANATATSGQIKAAKNTVADLIEDTWKDYTGEVNNLLLMDATAEAQSLTDSRNPSPTSIQVLIRTQEIKADDGTAEELAAASAPKTTFFQRVAQMFRDFWSTITGIFH